MKRFYYKVDAGAEWAITQPVFDLKALYRFMDYIEQHKIKVPIIAGIWPLLSLRNAQFMNNEVPGVVIPKEIMSRMAESRSPEDAKKVGVEIAQKMVEEIGDLVQGVQVSAPFGRIDLALQVVGKQ
jgi:homocysteine S-methyltransferase